MQSGEMEVEENLDFSNYYDIVKTINEEHRNMTDELKASEERLRTQEVWREDSGLMDGTPINDYVDDKTAYP